MSAWTIPLVHVGRTVAVLASGPSMSQEVADTLHLAGVPCIAVNTTHRLAPWAWALYAADDEWWRHPANADAHQFAGLRVSCQQVAGVLYLRNAGNVGYSDDPECVHTFGNSGAQAIQLAAKAGAARVLLAGFDFSGCHWHGKHPTGLRETIPEHYAKWATRMSELAAALALRGVDVVTVTPSALTCFRRSTLEDELSVVPA